jgi:hypothetical protein
MYIAEAMVHFSSIVAILATITPALANPLSASSVIARQTGELPSSFEWSSTGPIIGPRNDGRGIAALKDPSVIYVDGRYHVFVSTAQSSGYNLAYLSFTDWSEANDAELYYLDQSGIGTGYRAAPQVFYFEPQGLWYLVYQNGNAAYSTNPDINDPAGWTAPTNFYDGTPQIITDNIGDGYWVDMWVICDDSDCHLFSSDDNGHLYRSQTSISDFPNGMSDPVIDLEDSNRYNLFEAACVYTVGNGQYLLLHEAIRGDGERWFRSWTAPSISGPWTALADSDANPFASSDNVSFESGTPWTISISHGELVRTEVDQTLTINPCNLQFLYQGINPDDDQGDYNSLPWRLALLTQTNSAC